MKKNYTVFHLHSDYSNTMFTDSTSTVKQYIKKASELDMKSLAFSEHGNLGNWIAKKKSLEEAGIKYIHGVETYMTMTLGEKIRDSYHVGLYAKNYEGVLELNTLISGSYNKEDNHFYYRPRISYDELLRTSNNIIITTACLGGFLNKWDKEQNWFQQQDFLRFASNNKDRIFLEVQYHNNEEQKEYNKKLLDWSHEYDIRIIAGTDTHNVDDYASECRSLLQKAKNIQFSNEDEFDLTFKTYDELYTAFLEQGVLTSSEIEEAITNTNVMSDMIEEFELNYEFKYPQIYENPNEEFKKRIIISFNEKIENGILDPSFHDEYVERIKEEFNAYKVLNASSYMLFVADIYKWCKEENIGVGTRGSVTGSFLAFLVGITEIDSVKFGTVFSRFVNIDRVSLPDIDMDVPPKDREHVYDYVRAQMGVDNTSKIISFGTTQDKGTIDNIVRGLGLSLNLGKKIKDAFEKDEDSARSLYEEVMYYFDGIKDIIINKGEHPAGIIASPITLSDNLGVIRNSENEMVSSCDMNSVDELNYVKIDVLGLKNMAILNDTYRLANIKPLMSYNTDFDDAEVWNDIKSNSISIFQMESDYGHDSLKAIDAKSLDDMTVVNAAIRPSGASYRNQLFARRINKNPSKEIDEILKESYGYLVYQEQTIKFLQIACGFSGSESDTIRRYVSKKKIEKLNESIPSIIDGYCNNAGKDKTREIAEKEARQFIQTIQDSGEYQFNYNHALAYSMIGYKCGYLRYYYPIEFITSLLNNAKDEKDYVNGEKLAKFKNIGIEQIKYGFSQGDYTFDKETNIIYKGLSSIKFLKERIADEMLEVSKIKYDTFIDLLVKITEDTSVNTKQLDILIKLNFFSELGEVGRMIDIYNEFRTGKNQYKKTYVQKTKDKRIALLKEYELNLGDKYQEFDVAERISFEYSVLGKPLTTSDEYPKTRYFVLDIDTKYSPRLKLYNINSGKLYDAKIYKKTYTKNRKKIVSGNLLIVKKQTKKYPRTMNGDGNFVIDKTRKKENIIEEYDVKTIS